MARELVNRYPVGVQSFDDIRRRDLVYVDKTAYVWDLAHQGGKAFFLSRPRRFGKSLLLSTMQAYFEGRRELFDGLAIERLETEWETSPVIRLDMSTVKATSVEGLEAQIDDLLQRVEEAVSGGDRLAGTFGGRLAALIRHAAADRPASVVVLVDEYDAPLLNVIDDEVLLARFRQVMRELYAPLKSCDEHLRFVFLASITKFSQLSIFSELNNLSNISMEPRYAGICGITEDELRGQLAPDVAALANRGSVYNLTLLDRVESADGTLIEENEADLYNQVEIADSSWDAVQQGMMLVADDTTSLNALSDLGLDVAGKTGTAQQSRSHPNHALFVGYAPADNPEIAVAVRIANGYTSANAAEAAADLYKYYYNLVDEEEILTGTASGSSGQNIAD